MSSEALERRNVRELQRLAAEAVISPAKKKPNKRLSRAARLHLLDLLSRWSATGLAAVCGAAIFMAVMVGREFPARTAAWALLVFAAIWSCRTIQTKFRAGEQIASRPFRWRAQYTSCLSVLGVAFGAAPILLAPQGAAALLPALIALTLAGALVAGATHAAHRASVAALVIPSYVFVIAALFRHGHEALVIFGAAAFAVVSTAVISIVSWALYNEARKNNPRTNLIRSEVELANAGTHSSHEVADLSTKSA